MDVFFRLFGKKNKSGAIAKQRLKQILISDRADCSVDLIDAIKGDVSHTLSKYMEVDIKHMKVDIISNNRDRDKHSGMMLVLRIPFREINKVIC